MSSTAAIRCTDHLGNNFNSQREMCIYWEINPPTYIYRIKQGWSLGEALEKRTPKGFEIKDHLGNKYTTFNNMCITYSIGNDVVKERLKRGWSLGKALTTQVAVKEFITHRDHLGKTYTSLSRMCAAYNISRTLYNYRIETGWSIEEALTTPVYNKRLSS